MTNFYELLVQRGEESPLLYRVEASSPYLAMGLARNRFPEASDIVQVSSLTDVERANLPLHMDTFSDVGLTITRCLRELLHYNWDREQADYEEHRGTEGVENHVFASMVRLRDAFGMAELKGTL